MVMNVTRVNKSRKNEKNERTLRKKWREEKQILWTGKKGTKKY